MGEEENAALETGRDLLSQEREEAIREMLESAKTGIFNEETALIGAVALDREDFINTEALQTRAKDLSQRLRRGYRTEGLVSGYYHGSTYDEQGHLVKADPEFINVDRWAQAANGVGLDANPVGNPIPIEEKVDYVRGYLGRELDCHNSVRPDFLQKTLRVLAQLEDKPEHEIIQEYLEAFNAAVGKMDDEQRKNFYEVMQGNGYRWDESQKSFIIPEEPALV